MSLNSRAVKYMTNDHGATEDIIQEAFMKTLDKGPTIGDEKASTDALGHGFASLC